jgi:hypothetical protein
MALPRGVHEFSNTNMLAKSGTVFSSMGSLCFLPRVSHREESQRDGSFACCTSRDWADLMFEAWLHTAEASREKAFDALARRLQGAMEHHQSAKALDQALFGEDFEAA